MGRNKKEVFRSPITKAAEPIEAKKPEKTLSEIETDRAIVTSLDSEKSNKDILLKNIKELEQHRDLIKKEIENRRIELENRNRALIGVDNEIKSKAFELSKQTENFEKQNAEKVRILETKLKEVEEADAQYKKLTSEVSEKERTLKLEIHAISEERLSHKKEMDRLNRHVNDIEAEDSRLRADIEEREKALAASIAEFEAEKERLAPELRRISEIKNENELLLQRLEDEKSSFQRQQSIFDGHRAKMEADAVAGKEALRSQQALVANQEAKLRRWEQDLNDMDLELKAREAEVEKLRRRYQLKQVIEDKE